MGALQNALQRLSGLHIGCVLSRHRSAPSVAALIVDLGRIVAAWERIRNGQLPLMPSTTLSHAANFLYMLTGKEPETKAKEPEQKVKEPDQKAKEPEAKPKDMEPHQKEEAKPKEAEPKPKEAEVKPKEAEVKPKEA